MAYEIQNAIYNFNGDAFSMQGDTPTFTPAEPALKVARPSVMAANEPLSADATTAAGKETLTPATEPQWS